MAFAVQARSSSIAEMNITPLVDVMLVLLIIFMVATPLLSQPLTLDLPQPAPEPPPPATREIDLRIDAAGGLSWNGTPMSAAAVDALLRIEGAQAEAPRLALSIDADTDYAHVAALLGRAQAAGLERIALPAD